MGARISFFILGCGSARAQNERVYGNLLGVSRVVENQTERASEMCTPETANGTACGPVGLGLQSRVVTCNGRSDATLKRVSLGAETRKREAERLCVRGNRGIGECHWPTS